VLDMYEPTREVSAAPKVPRAALAGAFAVGIASGCVAGRPDPQFSPSRRAASQPGTPDCARVPDYETVVAPLVTTYCASCHSPAGIAGPDYDWTNRRTFTSERTAVAGRLTSRTMPPEGQPMPQASERATLVLWAQCAPP